MARVSVFVDGFNVYHALDRKPNVHKYKWLDYAALSAPASISFSTTG